MEGDLADTKHELLKIRSMLEMAEKVKWRYSVCVKVAIGKMKYAKYMFAYLLYISILFVRNIYIIMGKKVLNKKQVGVIFDNFRKHLTLF